MDSALEYLAALGPALLDPQALDQASGVGVEVRRPATTATDGLLKGAHCPQAAIMVKLQLCRKSENKCFSMR